MTKSTPAAAEELREFPTQQPKAVTGSTRRGTEGGCSGAQPAQSRTDRGTALHQGQGDTATPSTAILGSLSFPKWHQEQDKDIL